LRGASRTDETAVLFKLADLVLVPIRPSPSDLWAASATVELLKREKVPFLFVLNQVKANAGITGQAAAEREQTISEFMLACFHAFMKTQRGVQ
jgi:chromosome partitioning protein